MDLKTYLRFILSQKKDIHTKKVDSIFDINYKKLSENGIKLLIFDVDDTLCGHNEKLPSKTIVLLKKLERGFKIAFLSNCSRKRDDEIEKMIGTLKIFNERTRQKPGMIGYMHILKHFQIDPHETAMIGDRIGMDLFGAKNLKIKERILVLPYSYIFGRDKTNIFIKMIRDLENRHAMDKRLSDTTI